MEDSVFVTLSAPVEYGDNQSTDEIEIRCPSFPDAKGRKYYRHLKTLLARVIREMSEDETEKPDNEGKTSPENMQISPTELIFLLMSSIGDAYHDEVEKFISVVEGCCFLDEKTPLKSGPAGRISADDQEQLFGSYLANFIMPGLMSLMSGKD